LSNGNTVYDQLFTPRVALTTITDAANILREFAVGYPMVVRPVLAGLPEGGRIFRIFVTIQLYEIERKVSVLKPKNARHM